MIPVGDLTTWKNRLAMATDAELANLDQQIGPTHALRAVLSDEVTSRARQRAGIGAEFAPQPVQLPGQVPSAAPTVSAAIPAPPVAATPATPAMTPVQVPGFYNEGDRQLVRDTVQTMDRMGEQAPGVIRDYRQAAQSIYDEYAPIVGDVLTGWSDATRSTIDAWRPRLSSAFNEVSADIGNAVSSGYDLAKQTGFPAPAADSMLSAQITGGPTPGTSLPPSAAAMQPFTGNQAAAATIRPPAQPPSITSVTVPVVDRTGGPGEPPPPSAPSPLSHVTPAPAPRRKPDIPVVPPPQQTTKSANSATNPAGVGALQTGISAAEALNRFYAGQYSQGRIPGAPASVEDARTMASMGDFKGAWR